MDNATGNENAMGDEAVARLVQGMVDEIRATSVGDGRAVEEPDECALANKIGLVRQFDRDVAAYLRMAHGSPMGSPEIASTVSHGAELIRASLVFAEAHMQTYVRLRFNGQKEAALAALALAVETQQKARKIDDEGKRVLGNAHSGKQTAPASPDILVQLLRALTGR